MTPRRALGLLIVVSGLLRLGWASCLGLGYDEAYHALFVRHLDWSYYDHPPMMAIIEAVGLTASNLFGPVLALRLGFIGLFAGSTILMARLTSRYFGAWAGVTAAFLLNVSAYHTAAAGTFALPDGPLVFFWLLTLDRVMVALDHPQRTWPWIAVGLAWGAAFLSKYHAVLLPVGVLLYLILEPSARAWLRRPGPYLAVAIGLILFSPVVTWNATHGWASFAFQSGRAIGMTFRPDRLAGFLGGQALYLLPWIWLFLLGACWRHRRSLWKPGDDPHARFLLCQAIPVLSLFLIVACFRPVLPHWSLVGFLSVMPLVGADWVKWADNHRLRFRRRLAILAAIPLISVSLFAAQSRWGVFQREGHGLLRLLPAAHDPSVDMFGWDQIATELSRRGILDQPGTFVFTNRWYQSGQLAFALQDTAPVLCYNSRDAHAFAQWSRPEDWVGHDGILVLVNDSSTGLTGYERLFEGINDLGTFQITRAGGSVRRVQFYRCARQREPFPFDGKLREVAIRGPSGSVNTLK